MLQHHSKNQFGRVWGSIWEAFGTLRDVSWALLGTSWALFARSKCDFFKPLVQDGLQDAFGIDLAWIWEGFGMDLERILLGLGQILHVSGET